MEGENRLGGSPASLADYEQRRQPPGNVNKTVINRTRPTGNEGLVILVEQREGHDQRGRNQEPATADRRFWRRSKRARREKSENRVLREVGELSGYEMDHEKRFRSRIRKQPENEWSNNARCVSGREAAGGSEGDESEPGDQR